MKKKEISCRVTHTLLSYVREKNNGSLEGFLNGLELDESFLNDPHNWISHAFLQKLYHRLVRMMNDENAVYHMALSSAKYKSFGMLERIALLLGSPRLVYSQTHRYNKFLKLNGTVIVHEITKDTAVLEDRYHDDFQKTCYDCDYTRGILTGIPTIFGLPQANVEEVECQVPEDRYGKRLWTDSPKNGCPRCLYRISWVPGRLPFIKRFFSGYFQQKKAVEDLAAANQLIQSKYDEVKLLLKELEEKNQQLTESEQNYRLLAENMTDLVWIMDLATLKVKYVSPSVYKNRGYTPQEVMAMDLEDSVCPESYEKVAEILAEELANEEDPQSDPNRTRTIELRDTVKGGGYVWVETNVKFLRDEQGKAVSVIGVNRYINERKKAEEKIRQNEKKFRNLFENGSDLLCIHDFDGVLLDTNLHYKEEYGFKGIDLTGIKLKEMIPERHLEEFEAYLVRIKEKGKDEGLLSAKDRNGNYVVLEYRNQVIFDENLEPMHVQASARDVTERVKAQKALEESEDKYKSLVRYAPAGIFEFDLEKFRFISANDVMCKFTGFSREELLGMDPFALVTKDNEHILTGLITEIENEAPEENVIELAIRNKSGKKFRVVVNSRIYYEKGKAKRSMGIIHDLTAIRKAEEERRILENKLQQAHKMEAIGTLAGGIAHDFNNILAGVLGYCELLNNNLTDIEKAKGHVSRIQQGARRAADLVKQILDFSRETNYEIKGVPIEPIVSETLKLLRATLPKTIEIKKDLKCNDAVMGDPAKIHQIIMNLGTNAYHAMTENGGVLTVAASKVEINKQNAIDTSLAPGEYVEVKVSDTGHGMSETTLKRIFDPYFTTKEVGKGSGMGLAIVYAIVKEYKGAITAKSVPGKGSEFAIYFPISEEVQESPKLKKKEFHSFQGSETVMVVDDEVSILDSTHDMLADFGYTVHSYSNGKKALAAFLEDPDRFDLVITDMTMPEITGLELAKHIFEIRAHFPIILCTGYNESISKDIATEIGIARFLEKPLVEQSLLEIIREVLDQEKSGQ